MGVAGLVQSGGFGSFSKAYGLAAAGLLESEVVTADGEVRIANAGLDPDLFWGLKGGGGGSLGIVTRLTLRTRELPETPPFGAVFGSVRARSDAAFRELVGRTMALLPEASLQPALGRADGLRARERPFDIGMVFQGLDRAQAEAHSEALPRVDERRAGGGRGDRAGDGFHRRAGESAPLGRRSPRDRSPEPRSRVMTGRARPRGNFFWSGDRDQVGHGAPRLQVRLAARGAPSRRRSPRRSRGCSSRGAAISG